MIAFIKKLLGISDLEYKVRLLQRQKYWQRKNMELKMKRNLVVS